MNRDFIAKHWYACLYERQETQTDDIEFLLDVLGPKPVRILEACCGGGRMSEPLARAGHDVTGFDADIHMLLRCHRRAQGLPNLRCFQADAVHDDWGTGYDVVLLACNILINIETEAGYQDAQRMFLIKAARSLRPGGHLFLDFDLLAHPERVFHRLPDAPSSYFEGTDDMGTWGRTMTYGGVYDPVTRISTGAGHTEIRLNDGTLHVIPRVDHKHIPTREQVQDWLDEAGFAVEREWADYREKPRGEDTHRATLWARRA